MGKAIEGGRCRLLRRREHDQHGNRPAFRAVTPPSAEGEPTVLRQDLKVTKSARAESRRQFHSQTSPLSRELADAPLPLAPVLRYLKASTVAQALGSGAPP